MTFPTSKVGKVTKEEFYEHAQGINRLETGEGTFNNPILDYAVARPIGMNRVFWDCAFNPINWVDGDFNFQNSVAPPA